MTEEQRNEPDWRVATAVMAEQIKGLSREIANLNDTNKRYIEVTEKKMDRDTYLSDKNFQASLNKKYEASIGVLEDFKKGFESGLQGRQQEREKIWGISTGTIGVLIQLGTLLTVAIGIATAVAKINP